MKRRGFTLVELIAVVVVLAVLSLITVPIVFNQIETSRQESYKASVRSIFEAVSSYSANNMDEEFPAGGILIPTGEIYQKLGIKNADFTGGRIYRDEKGILMVENVTNGSYCASGSKNKLNVVKGNCSLLDTSAPIVAASVSKVTTNSITVAVNANDPESNISGYKYYLAGVSSGYTGEAKLVAEIQDNVYTFSGLKAGRTYTMYVVATNGVGIDSKKYPVSYPTPSSNITFTISPSGWAKSKNVTINYPESVGTEVRKYKIAGQTDWLAIKGSKTEFTVTKSTSVVAGIFDGNNNLIYSDQQIVGSIDNDSPYIFGLDGNSDTWAKKKEISILAEDTGVGIATKNGYSFDGGETWQASKTKTFTKPGTVYVRVKDALGNVSDVKEYYVQYIDSTEPKDFVVSAAINIATGDSYDSGTWTNQDIVLIANPNPAPEDIPSKGYYYQWYFENDDGEYEALSGATGRTLTLTGGSAKLLDRLYMVKVKTRAGSNWKASSNQITVKIDKLAPSCLWSGESTTWENTDRVITLTCDDGDGQSGCKESRKLYGYNNSIKTSREEYLMVDKAGNYKYCVNDPLELYIDKTAPTVTVTKVTTSTRAVGVVFNATDEHSGIDTSKYPYECMLLTPAAMSGSGSGTYAGTITTSGTTSGTAVSTTTGNSCKYTNLKNNSTYYYKIVVKDAVGNPTIVTNSFRTDDFGNISVSWTDSEKWTTNKDVTITADQTKDEVTGNKMKLQYQLQDVYMENNTYKCEPVDTTTSAWTNIDSGYKFNIAKKVCVYTRLNDGYNTTSAKTDMITKVDITPPTIPAPTATSTSSTFTLKYALSDSESGIDQTNSNQHKCYFKSNVYTNGWEEGTISSTGCSKTGLTRGHAYEYKIVATDAVGNTDTRTGTINYATCSISYPSGWAKSKDVTITAPSGSTSLKYKIGNSGAWTSISSGSKVNVTSNTTVYCEASDGTNTGSASGTITGIDTTGPAKPTVSLKKGSVNGSTYTSGTWSTSDVWHIVNSSDSQSGVAYYQYSHNGTSGWTSFSDGWESYYSNASTKQQFNYAITWDGTWNFYVRAVDNVGNVSANSDMFTVKIDKTKPTIKYSESGGTYTTTSKSIYITSSDNLAYNYTSINLYKNGSLVGSWTNSDIENRMDLSSTGTWKIDTRVYDKVGNYTDYSQTYILNAAASGTTTPSTPSTTACANNPNHAFSLDVTEDSSVNSGSETTKLYLTFSGDCLKSVSKVTTAGSSHLCYRPYDLSLLNPTSGFSSYKSAALTGFTKATASMCDAVNFSTTSAVTGTINNLNRTVYVRATYTGYFDDGGDRSVSYLIFPGGFVDYSCYKANCTSVNESTGAMSGCQAAADNCYWFN